MYRSYGTMSTDSGRPADSCCPTTDMDPFHRPAPCFRPTADKDPFHRPEAYLHPITDKVPFRRRAQRLRRTLKFPPFHIDPGSICGSV